MFKNRLKTILKNGGSVIGNFSMLNSPEIVEMLGIAGFDFVILDTEHGPAPVYDNINLIRAAESKGMTPIVRVTESSATTILRNLDIGAHGIVVPQVNDRETAQNVVKAAKYYPMGERGVALARAGNYGQISSIMDYFKEANEETLVIVQCESQKGLDNLEEIASVPGVDGIFYGPFDMSQSMGIPGQLKSEKLEKATEKILTVSKESGKFAGTFANDWQTAKKRLEEGFQFVGFGMDSNMIVKHFSEELTKVKG